MKKLVAIAAVCLLIAGCQTSAPAPHIETDRTFNRPYDSVWAAVVRVVSSSDYSLKIVQKDSGVIETEAFNPGILRGEATPPRGLFLPCWGDARAHLSILVMAESNTNTTVRINGHFECFEYNVTHAWFVWNSTGVLENQLLEKIATSIRP